MNRKTLLTAVLAAVIAGCGFHLRQPPVLPPVLQKLYIVSEAHDAEIVRELRRSLESESTAVLDDPTKATATLSIINVYESSRPLVLNRRGQPLMYQAAYSAEYTLVAGGVVLIPPEVQTLTRNYNFSVTNGIANEEQEASLYNQLAKEMAQLIIFRLQAVARGVPASATAPLPASTTHPPPIPAAPAATQIAPGSVTRVPPAVTHAPPMVN
ncbi:MAG: LPS assembly lipoprotein LptE [Bacillota bacterium]